MKFPDYRTAGLIVSILMYLLYITGFYLLISDDLGLFIRSIELRKKLKPKKSRKDGFNIIVYINKVLSSLSGKDVNSSGFIFALLVVFSLVFIFGLRIFSPLVAIFSALMSASVPLMIMIIRLESVRNKGSREGISFLAEFYRQYRMSKRNIYTAMENCLKSQENFPVCGRQLYKLLLHLRSCGSPSEIRECTDQFAFALGTMWGNTLAVCIRIAAEKGTDVSEGLSDLVVQLKSANLRAEERRRLNSESNRMTVFLVPLLYLGTSVLSVTYLDLSPADFIKNQFLSPEGLLFFVFIVFLFFFNLALLKIVDNVRMDF